MYLPNAKPVDAARLFNSGGLRMFGIPASLGAILLLVPPGPAGRIFIEELKCGADEAEAERKPPVARG
jgi:hypothetical protein